MAERRAGAAGRFGPLRLAARGLGLLALAASVGAACWGQTRWLGQRGLPRLRDLATRPADQVLADALAREPAFLLCRQIRHDVPPNGAVVFDGFVLDLPYVRYFLFPRRVYAVEYDDRGADAWALAAARGATAVVIAGPRAAYESDHGVPPQWAHAGDQPAMQPALQPLHFYRYLEPER